MKNQLLVTSLLFGAVASVSATDIDFTYNVNHDPAKVYGFDKKETYDVAIKIDDPAYIGAKVTGITVAFPVSDGNFTDATAWLASELKLESRKNAPDLGSVSASVDDELLTATFTTPVEIPAAGIWVGYSFNITGLDKTYEYDWPDNPVACVESENNLEKGLWIHTSRSRLKWTDVGTSLGAVSTMIVHLATDFGPHDVAIGVPAESYMVKGETYNVPFTLINHGTEPLEDLTFSYSIGGFKSTGSLHLDTPLKGLGNSTTVNLPLGPVDECGEYALSVTLETSNGEANGDPMRTGTGNMNVWPLIPVTRPLVEEYTGLNCGYCPVGYVAMEYMSENLGDMFVGLAFHCQSYESGKMETVSEYDFPSYVTGYPASGINRAGYIYPGDLPFRWDSFAAQIVPASVDVDLRWDDTVSGRMIATSKVAFVKDVENADYRLGFAIVADNVFNASWGQKNYYAGEAEGVGVDSPLWDVFLDGGSTVKGLTFNDVVAYMPEVDGIANSVPTTIKAGEVMTYEYPVNAADMVNLRGQQFLNPEAKLKAVAILFDGKTGLSVNCNKSAHIDYAAGVSDLTEDAPGIVSTVYHNLQGVRVDNPVSGLYLKTVTLSDGTVRTSKVLL